MNLLEKIYFRLIVFLCAQLSVFMPLYCMELSHGQSREVLRNQAEDAGQAQVNQESAVRQEREALEAVLARDFFTLDTNDKQSLPQIADSHAKAACRLGEMYELGLGGLEKCR